MRSSPSIFRVPNSHPCLAGHFPDQPIVPGVLLLEHVQSAAECWLGHEFTSTRWAQIKFMRPLLPEQEARVDLEQIGDGPRIRFWIRATCDDALIAAGEFSASLDPRND